MILSDFKSEFLLSCSLDISYFYEVNRFWSCKCYGKNRRDGMPSCSSWTSDWLPSNGCHHSARGCYCSYSSLYSAYPFWNQEKGIDWHYRWHMKFKTSPSCRLICLNRSFTIIESKENASLILLLSCIYTPKSLSI